MIIEPVEFKIDSNLFGIDTHQRSSGLHVSEIISSLDNKKFSNSFTTDDLEVYRTMGFAWERVLMIVLEKECSLKKVGEIKRDGVTLTPDPINETLWSLEEWKCTWRSMGNLIKARDEESGLREHFRGWLWQIKSYLYALNMEEAIIRVMFVNGDYAKNRKPTPWCRRLIFKQRELKDNWEMLLQHARDQEMLK